jgi:predicted ATP-grasp superfamily ATP-dependent carboligase
MCGVGSKVTYRILVTDGENKNTLAILRSLGKNKEKYEIEVTSIYRRMITLSWYSRYCQKIHFLKPEDEGVDSYAEKLLEIVNKGGYDVFLPVGFESYIAVSKYAKKFRESAGIAVPEWEKMQVALNKDMTMKFAREVGVPIPKTKILLTENDLEGINDQYPIVIKSSDGFLRYCNNKNELLKNFKFIKGKSRMGIIAQEYIRGFGCGFYGVYDRGKLIAHILQKRLKEFPVTGGPSAVAESYSDERLLNYGKKLCDALNWHGPIMAEFKYDTENNDYRLIELNPKLWNSLDLTIAAGIDVPEILVNIALGKRPKILGGYKYVKYKWLFPDELWALVSDFSFANLKEFFKYDGDVGTNYYSDDIKPFIVQMIRALATSPAVLINSGRRFPHGKVTVR